jgi:tetratricopeptide (TPR) repeat protein
MYAVNIRMETELLIAQGNTHRERHQPDLALACYAQAFVQDHTSASAFNNYGNVLREMGFPDRAQPFLEHAIRIDPANEIARFNLSVCLLLQGDYARGWPAYEDRWTFEHLKGALPQLPQPRWTGQDLSGKTILVIGEQGLGDTVQFLRFVENLHQKGASVVLVVDPAVVSLCGSHSRLKVIAFGDALPEYNYWTPIMSIPGILNITLDQLASPLNYLSADPQSVSIWQQRLGLRRRLRVGFSWSGRRDSWIHQHKSVPFQQITELIRYNPNYEWVNLQIDASDEESQVLQELGCATYPGTISCVADSAALISCMDVVVSVDTLVSHLSAALGRPTWIMLNHYGTDWRWLLNRADSPWYPTAKLFRQPTIGNWGPVITDITRHLNLFKI